MYGSFLNPGYIYYHRQKIITSFRKLFAGFLRRQALVCGQMQIQVDKTDKKNDPLYRP